MAIGAQRTARRRFEKLGLRYPQTNRHCGRERAAGSTAVEECIDRCAIHLHRDVREAIDDAERGGGRRPGPGRRSAAAGRVKTRRPAGQVEIHVELRHPVGAQDCRRVQGNRAGERDCHNRESGADQFQSAHDEALDGCMVGLTFAARPPNREPTVRVGCQMQGEHGPRRDAGDGRTRVDNDLDRATLDHRGGQDEPAIDVQRQRRYGRNGASGPGDAAARTPGQAQTNEERTGHMPRRRPAFYWTVVHHTVVHRTPLPKTPAPRRNGRNQASFQHGRGASPAGKTDWPVAAGPDGRAAWCRRIRGGTGRGAAAPARPCQRSRPVRPARWGTSR